MFRTARRTAPALLASLLTIAACEDDPFAPDIERPTGSANAPAPPPPPPAPPATPSLAGRYAGTLVTTVEYRDAFGRVIGRETYRIDNATVTIAPPRSYRGQTEQNPVSFILESNPNAPGALSVYSSFGGTYTDPRTHRSVDALFTSWRLSVNGTRITGEMFDNLTAMASNVSQLMAGHQLYPGAPWTLWPFPLRNGTQFTARLTGNTLTVDLQGNTASGTRPFTAQLVATRR